MGTKNLWVEWFDKQDRSDQRCMALHALERLIELEEISFRVDDVVDLEGNEIPEDEIVDECLYWTGSGEDLRIPF